VFSSKISQATLAPQQGTTDTIRFTPASAVGYNSYLLIASNASATTDTVFLNGMGIAGKFVQLQFSKQLIPFGPVPLAYSRDSVINVANIGNDTAIVTVTASDSGFVPIPLIFSVAPSGSTPLTLRFAPYRLGAFSGRFVLVNSRTTPSSDTINVTGLGTTLTGVASEPLLPKQTALLQNYPNPFNPTTALSFQLATPGQVMLKIFNTLGKEVYTVINAYRAAGSYSINFDASRLSSGIYFYTLQSGKFIQTRKMLLIK
jgi:hypothetical protein